MEEIVINFIMKNITVVNTGSNKGFIYSKMLVKIGVLKFSADFYDFISFPYYLIWSSIHQTSNVYEVVFEYASGKKFVKL